MFSSLTLLSFLSILLPCFLGCYLAVWLHMWEEKRKLSKAAAKAAQADEDEELDWVHDDAYPDRIEDEELDGFPELDDEEEDASLVNTTWGDDPRE